MELKSVEALKLWHNVVADTVRDDGPDLSSRQMAILLKPSPRDFACELHAVNGIAMFKHIGITVRIYSNTFQVLPDNVQTSFSNMSGECEQARIVARARWNYDLDFHMILKLIRTIR